MNVKQIRLNIYMLQDVSTNNMQKSITSFIDRGFLHSEKLSTLHEKNTFKLYCYDLPYPIEKDKLYKQGKIYTLTIRTVDNTLARYFSEICVNNYTQEIKGLTVDIRILPKKHIDRIYTVTPLIIKSEQGYWRSCMSVNDFEQRLKVNLIKKWNSFNAEKIDEDFDLYTGIEFINKTPISMAYKTVKLLGDKIRLNVSDNATAQKLIYMALGTGIGEMNSRGAGFINYRWL